MSQVKYIIFFLLLFYGCRSETVSDEEITEVNRFELESQEYPLNIEYWNYHESIPESIRELVNNFGFSEVDPRFASERKLKNRIFQNFHDGYMLISEDSFDRFGNTIYSCDLSIGKCTNIRYIVSDSGHLIQKKIILNEVEFCKNYTFIYNDQGYISEVLEESIDTTLIHKIEYDSRAQIIKAGNYTYRYDEMGNCVEGWIKYTDGICGNVLTHWEKKFDKENNLVSTSTNMDDLYIGTEDYAEVNTLKSYDFDSIYNEENLLTEIVAIENDSIRFKIIMEYYE